MARYILILSILGWHCLGAEEAGRVSSEETAVRIEQSRAVMEDFKARLDAAQTAEERHAVALEMVTKLRARLPRAIDGKSAQENLAAAKAIVADNPQLLARLEKQEARLIMIEQIKAKLQEAGNAEGPQKQELLEQAGVLRAALGQSIKQEREVAFTKKQSQSVPSAELAARIEERKQATEDLRKALGEAKPGERTKILVAWRAKRQAEMENQQ